MGKSKNDDAYIFVAYNSLTPYTYPTPTLNTGGQYIPNEPPANFQSLLQKNFQYIQTTVNPPVFGPYTSDYVVYTGDEPIVASIQVDFAIANVPLTVGSTIPNSNFQYVVYKGSHGQFPSVPIVPIHTTLTLTPDSVIHNGSANGLIPLCPGDTLTLYVNISSDIPYNSPTIYSFMVTIKKEASL